MDFHTLSRKELQALCKKNGIPANITNVAMADALFALNSSVKGNEETSDCSQFLTAQSSVESPERSEVTSPRIRTRSVRKKVENQTLVNQTMSRTRISTRNLIHGYADKKDTVAPINIDVQFSEVDKQSKIKEACVTQTSSMVSGTQKRTSKGESTVRKTYGTRRSTRLAGKTSDDTTVENKGNSYAANVKLFSADCGDNFETNVEEFSTDISEDVQSTISHLEEVMETSKCEEMTSNYSSLDTQNDLVCDSSKDFNNKSSGKVKTGITDEENGTQENIWIEENKGDEIHEQTEVENKDEVIEENGYDINEQTEVEVNHEVNGDNGEDFSKKPEVVTGDEGDKLNGNEGEVVNGDEACGVDISVIIDNETEKNDLALGENGDMIVETEDHGCSDAHAVKEVSPKSLGEQLDDGNCDKISREDWSSEDLVEVAEEHLDNNDLDSNDCDESDKVISKKDEFLLKLSAKEGDDLVKVEAKEQLVDDGDRDKPSQEIAKEDEFLSKPAEEVAEEGEEAEEEVVNVAPEEQLVSGDCDKPSQEIVKENEFLPKPVLEEEVDIVKGSAGEQSVNGDRDKLSQEITKEDKFLPKLVEKEEEEEEEEEVVMDIVKVDGGCYNPSQENAKEDASIYIDVDRIFIPVTAIVDKKKSASIIATTNIMDNPNPNSADSVMFGKENIDEHNLGSVKEEKKKQQQSIDYNNLKDYSLRKLKFELKEQLNSQKENLVKKVDEELETITVARRTALQMLPENQL